MVVVLVIWVKTGAPSPARNAAGQEKGAELLRISGIVAKLVFAPADKPRPAQANWCG
jgi:hypothetical protein